MEAIAQSSDIKYMVADRMRAVAILENNRRIYNLASSPREKLTMKGIVARVQSKHYSRSNWGR